MDYWCALWFWPIEKADQLPTRDEYLMELQYILQGTKMKEFGTSDDNGQILLFPSEQRQQQIERSDDLGTVNVHELIETFPRLKTVQQITDEQHFLHWELEYADIFNYHGGFDLILGNPPWVKPDWNETGLLSDFQPMFAVKNLPATKVAELRNETIEKYNLREPYLSEYETMTGSKNFLNALCNYPDLLGMKANLYKCFLPQAWMINTKHGVSAFLHPEGVYDDPAGGKLRREIYARIRDHFQFINELRLFADVDHHTKFSINVYGEALPAPTFKHLANLFTVTAIADSFQNSAVPVSGIKDDQDQWNRAGHPDRIIPVTQKELELFAKLYDEPGTPFQEARLPAIHATQLTNVLEKFADFQLHMANLTEDYLATQHWNETIDQQNRTMRRETQFPADAEHMILSGPHFFVGNPFYKTPRFPCRLNSDYDTIDLTEMPPDYLPRTNYIPDCDMAEYRRRTPYCPWDIQEDVTTQQKVVNRRVTDYYRIISRRMIGSASERTLIPALFYKDAGHIDTCFSIAFREVSLLISAFSTFLSLPIDFFVKTTGKTDARGDLFSLFPIVKNDNRLILRALLLSCLTEAYADLWHGAWCDDFAHDVWAKNDPRLPQTVFCELTPDWKWETPLRTDYARRQALIEIDVLVARALGLTLEELCSIYRIQFPVLKQNENDTWYDQQGRIVFTCSKGLPGVGFDRLTWNTIKDLKADAPCPTRMRNLDWLPEDQRTSVNPTITYDPPFDKCDRESDYHTTWQFFDQFEKG